MEKLERKDPMKRFSEKVAVNKAVSHGNLVRDNSPPCAMRSPKPKRAIRFFGILII